MSPIHDMPRSAPPREGKTAEGPQAPEQSGAVVVDLAAWKRDRRPAPRPGPDAA